MLPIVLNAMVTHQVVRNVALATDWLTAVVYNVMLPNAMHAMAMHQFVRNVTTTMHLSMAVVKSVHRAMTPIATTVMHQLVRNVIILAHTQLLMAVVCISKASAV